jgi:hypothetical protein
MPDGRIESLVPGNLLWEKAKVNSRMQVTESAFGNRTVERVSISNELLSIFREIIEERKTVGEWAAVESDDMFQIGNYSGGFDATENAFCFSFYNGTGEEFWFQLELDEIKKIGIAGKEKFI